MIYDYRPFIEDRGTRKSVDKKMNSIIGDKRSTYHYKKMQEVYLGSTNELYKLMEQIQRNDVVYVYDMSWLGNDDDEALDNIDALLKLNVEIIECKGLKEPAEPYASKSQDNIVDDTQEGHQDHVVEDVNSIVQQESTSQSSSLIKTDNSKEVHTDTVAENIEKNVSIDSNKELNRSNVFDYKHTNGYSWVKNKLKDGQSKEHIIIGFNTLHEFNPDQFSIDGKSPLTNDVLDQWIEEINNSNISDSGDSFFDWRDKSFAFQWICDQFRQNVPENDIIYNFNSLHNDNPKRFSTCDGGILTNAELIKCNQAFIQITNKEKRIQKRHENQVMAFKIIEEEFTRIIKSLNFKSEQDFFIEYKDNIITIEDNDSI